MSCYEVLDSNRPITADGGYAARSGGDSGFWEVGSSTALKVWTNVKILQDNKTIRNFIPLHSSKIRFHFHPVQET